MIASGELFEVIGEMEYDKFKMDVFYIRVTPQLGVEWPASECGGCQTSHDFYSVRSYRQSLGGNEHSSNPAF